MNLHSNKRTKILLISTVLFLLAVTPILYYSASRRQSSLASKSPNLSEYQIQERRELPQYVLFDVYVSGPSTQEELWKHIQAISKEENKVWGEEIKARKGPTDIVIWFYDAKRTVGTFDSRKSSSQENGLIMGSDSASKIQP